VSATVEVIFTPWPYDAVARGVALLDEKVPGWRELDLAASATRLWVNGAEAAAGSGAAVLGDPRTALVWLAGQLERFGTGLRAGDVVTTGTTTAPPAIGPGDAVRADFGPLGGLELSFAR